MMAVRRAPEIAIRSLWRLWMIAWDRRRPLSESAHQRAGGRGSRQRDRQPEI